MTIHQQQWRMLLEINDSGKTLGQQGSHRFEKYLNIKDCLEKSLKIKFALKST